MSSSLLFLVVIGLIVLSAFLIWNGDPADLIKALRLLSVPLVIVFLLHLFLAPGHAIFKIWFLKATRHGVYDGILYCTKFIVFAIAAYIIFLLTDPVELITPLERLAKYLGGGAGRIISSFALAFFLALRFLPELSEQARMTSLMLKSRGLDFKGNLIHKARVASMLMAPLFVNAFKRAELTAGALNVKGYATRYKRAIFPPVRINFGDAITALAAVIVVIAGWRTL